MKKINNAELATRLEPLCLKTASKMFTSAHLEIAKRAARAIIRLDVPVSSSIVRLCVSNAGLQMGVEFARKEVIVDPEELLKITTNYTNYLHKYLDTESKQDIVQEALLFCYEYTKTEEISKVFLKLCVYEASRKLGYHNSRYHKKITAKNENGQTTDREKLWLENYNMAKDMVHLDDDTDDTVFQLHATTPAPDAFIEYESIEIAKKMIDKIIAEDTENDNLIAAKEVIELMQVGETLEAAAKTVGKSAQLIHYHLRRLGKQIIDIHGREALFA